MGMRMLKTTEKKQKVKAKVGQDIDSLILGFIKE